MAFLIFRSIRFETKALFLLASKNDFTLLMSLSSICQISFISLLLRACFRLTYPNIRSSNFFLCYNCADAPMQKKIRIWAKIKFNSLMYVIMNFIVAVYSVLGDVLFIN